MMHRMGQGYTLCAADGTEIGQIFLVLSYSSSEENLDGDVEKATDTVHAAVPARYAPPGGFRRGMRLVSRRGEVYRILSPFDLGRLWRLKCHRTVTEEGAYAI